jgi:hypothetical protein
MADKVGSRNPARSRYWHCWHCRRCSRCRRLFCSVFCPPDLGLDRPLTNHLFCASPSWELQLALVGGVVPDGDK